MSQVTGETAEYVVIIRQDPCAYCGAPMEHVDHIVPFADGGPTDWTNLAPACANCNHRKSRMPLLLFLLSEKGGDLGVGRASKQAA
jgi:5-methylcytosine-specific restriction endonuclease McrA